MGFLDGLFSLAGGLIGKSSTEKANAQNIALQKEFAQTGIQWKVADAKKAGIHPLYALGANTASFSPSVVGDTSLATGVANMGQDISRAVHSTRSASERVTAYVKTAQDLQLQNAALQNEQLAIQNAKLRASPNPPMPSSGDNYLVAGQAQSGVKDMALERIGSAPGVPSIEPGSITDLGYARTPKGYAPVPSYDVKQRIEDQIIPELMWSIRNNVLPSLFLSRQVPPAVDPGPGNVWIFHPFAQEYRAVPKNSSAAKWFGRR